MRARRIILLAGIATGALMYALAANGNSALAATPADMGGWGQAWGDDDTPQPEPVRPRTVVPSPAPVTTTQPARATAPSRNFAPADVGGWGDAWGDGAANSATVTTAPETRPQAAPIPAPAASGPKASEIGGWGQAWSAVSDPVPPASAPVVVPDATPVVAPMPPATTPTAIPVAAPTTNAAVSTVPVSASSDVGIGTVVPSRPAPRVAPMATPAQDGEPPVNMSADQILYDRDLGIVTAKGRVEVAQQTRMLVADQISYNLRQDVISASGNVILTEPTGETLFTNYFELTGDMKEGVAQEIHAILSDNSRMAAASARRVSGNRTDFDKGTYTACEPCRSNPNKQPLWQAKAERITHNQDDATIEYRDAWLELAGVPVMYTPYLSHPDPSVRRQSGFLAPSMGMSSNIGTNFTVPYYWAIKDNQDITFAPRILFPSTASNDSSDLAESDSVLRRFVLAGEHRWRGMDGEEKTFASLTADKHTGDLRGHIDSTATFNLDNNWRAGYQLQRSTDDTYMAVYSYPVEAERPWLTTRPYIEGYGRRNYTVAEAFSYQGLRQADDPGVSPIVLPHIASSHMTTPDSKGGYYTIDNDLLAYGRSEGTSATRASTTVGWHRPYYGSLGDITTVSTSLRGDAYHSYNMPDIGTANSGRAVPLVSANWSMPFVRPSRTMPQMIEPMMMVAASPNGGNPDKIPNEDSVGFELDETNVFRPNRLPGLDRVEGGLRGAYGLRWQAYPGNAGTVTGAVAQGWRTRTDSTFRQGAGFDDNLSDYLARLDYIPASFLAFYNRARINKDHGDLGHTENTVSIGNPMAKMDISYLMYERSDDETDPLARQHYIAWNLTSAITRYWSWRGGITYDLTDSGGPIGWNTRLGYDDECFAFYTEMRQNYTHDRDYLTGYSLTFNVIFKTMTDVPFNAF